MTRIERDRRSVMVADGSGERVVGDGNAPTWSPDGGRLAVLQARPEGDQRLIVMNADGGSARELGIVPLQRVSWSPDGSRIAVRGAAGSGCRICVVDVVGGVFKPVSDGVDGVPVWAIEGSQLLVGEADRDGGRLVRLGLDGEVIGVDLEGQTPAGAVWSPDGRSMAAIATRDGRREIALVPVGEEAVAWLAADGDVIAFAWRPLIQARPLATASPTP
jgi:TolB protein